MSQSVLQIIGRRVFLLLELERYSERDNTLTDIRIRDLTSGPISLCCCFYASGRVFCQTSIPKMYKKKTKKKLVNKKTIEISQSTLILLASCCLLLVFIGVKCYYAF